MNKVIHKIILDMKSIISQQTIDIQRYDTGRKLAITLTDDGRVYQIAPGCRAVFTASKPDGAILFNECLIVGNTIEFDLAINPQVSNVVGEVKCEIRLYGADGTLITSPCFSILVDKTVYTDGDVIESSSEFSALSKVIADANESIQGANEAIANAESVVSKSVVDAETKVNNAVSNANTAVSKAASDAEKAVEEAVADAEKDITAAVADMRSIVDDSANAFLGNVRGPVVSMSDVSPIEHNLNCKVKSVNLFNDLLDYTKTQETVWTYENGVLYVANHYVNKFITLEEGKTYTFSCKSTKSGGNGGGVYIRAYTVDRGEQVLLHYNTQLLSPTVTFTMPYGYPVLRLTFYGDTAASTYSATYSELMLVEGSEAKAYIPYVDPSSVKVTRHGKNLIPYPYYQSTSSANDGTISVKEDGGIAFQGTPTGYVGMAIYKGKALVKSGKITLSNFGTSKNTIIILYMYDSSGETVATQSTTKSITVNLDNYPTVTDWNITGSRAVSNQEISGIMYPQLEVGDVSTEYEPYKGTETYTPNSDGTVDGIKSLSPNMTLLTDTDNTEIVCEYNRDSNVVLKELLGLMAQGGLSTSVARIVDVSIYANKWVGTKSPYSQVVEVEGATEYSQVDLTPSVEQLSVFYNKSLAFVTENVDGVVTVYAIGQKPTNDYTIQATVKEVKI